jgi:predicted Zn-dependent protease
VIARIALAAGALVVAVLIGLLLHSESRLQDGRRVATTGGGRPIAAARRAQAIEDLRAGARLHPGTEALLARALVELRGGSAAAAERLARRAVDREPDNFEAWRALAAALRGQGDPGAAKAARTAQRLNPLAR